MCTLFENEKMCTSFDNGKMCNPFDNKKMCTLLIMRKCLIHLNFVYFNNE